MKIYFIPINAQSDSNEVIDFELKSLSSWLTFRWSAERCKFSSYLALVRNNNSNEQVRSRK